MDITEYTTQHVNRGGAAAYTQDYLGAVRMLEESGFSPFSKRSPLNSTLNQVFGRFVEKTGIGEDASVLIDDFLKENPQTQRALNLYGSLENNFTTVGKGQQAEIVEFLNGRIDAYVSQKDQNSDETLTLQESDISETLFEDIDMNNDSQLEADELKRNFYEGYREFSDVLNYFRTTPGVLIDFYS